MIELIKKSTGLKVALITNSVLLIIIIAGGAFLVNLQCKRLEEGMLERGRIESILGAVAIGRILEEAVDNGVFAINDVFDTKYKPIPGFDPAKYHTKYDSYLDKAIIDLQDAFLTDKDNIFAIAVDKNGYCPTHNMVFQKGITGDVEIDKVGNRTKRIFNDPIGKKAALNKEQGFRQIYFRDTGEELWDISSPVIVRGRHWGGFRIGVSLEKIKNAKINLMVSLTIIMACILLVSMVCVFITVNYFIKPLRELKDIANSVADGDINRKVPVNSEDEIGKLAGSIERLRISMKLAMERLKKK